MKTFVRLVSTLALSAGLAAVSAGSAHGQDAKKNAASTVAGTWTLTVMSHQVGLVLEQDGTKVTGTLMMMGTDVKVDGDYVDGVLKLSSNALISPRPPADTSQNAHPTPSGGTPLKITAKLQDDGTLAGEMPGPNGPMTWVAERLKERKVKTPASLAGPSLTGAWKMAAVSPQGAMAIDLTLKQDGEKITGTLTSPHSGEVSLEGTYANGVLEFSTGGTGPDTMHLDYSAKLKDDGTLAGELTGTNVTMPWTAERVKK